MLWTPGSHFNWFEDNLGATYSDSGIGVNAPGHANANTKGANTSLLAGISEDCYGIAIGFCGGNTGATIRRNLVDILVDPNAGVGNAGSSWSVMIANLYCSYASLSRGAYWYYFPLYLKAGTAIGAANQSLTSGTSALRVMVRVFGKPTRPELLRVGSRVETFGAVTASTTGTGFTPGTNAMGSYSASLGATAHDLFAWQCGIGFNDAGLDTSSVLVDIAASLDAGTTKTLCLQHKVFNFNTDETGGSSMNALSDIYDVPAGANIYARGASSANPNNTTPTVIAYGVGA